MQLHVADLARIADAQEIQKELDSAEKYLAGVEKQYETGLAGIPPFKWLPWFGNRSG